MSCSIKDKREAGISTAISKFIGNATSFTKVNDNTVLMRPNDAFSKNQLLIIAKNNVERVAKWADKEYGPKFQYGWIDIDTTGWNTVSVRFRIPPALSTAWEVEDEIISIEEANNNLSLPDVGNDFFMGDPLLADQWERELTDESIEYADFTESIVKEKGKNEFSYDKTLEVKNPVRLEDDILEDLSNDLNVC